MRTPVTHHTDPASFRRLLQRAILLPLILTAILAGLFLWQISRLLSAAEWVEHTDEVIAQANGAQKLFIDMETGMRGYLITGKREFLEPYDNASRQINPALDELSRLVSDNPPQGKRLEDIRSQYAVWANFARDVVAVKDSGGDYQPRISSRDGKRMMDGIRAQFASFIGTEEGLRDERTRTTRQATRLAVGISLVAALSLGVLLVVFIRRQIVTVSNSYEQALSAEQEQRKWLGTTLISIGDAVIATDGEGRVTLMNVVAESLTGWTNAEAAGRLLPEVFRIVNEDTRAAVDNPVDKVLREGHVVGLANHTLLIAKDGHEIPIDDSGAPIKDDEGKIVGVVLVFRDISERKKLESERERFLSVGSDLQVINGTEGYFKWVNPAWEKALGWTLEEMTTKPWRDFVHPDDLPDTTEEAEGSYTGRETLFFENRYLRKDSSYLWLSWRARTYVEDKAIYAVATDITERKLADQALRESEERYRSLFNSLDEGFCTIEVLFDETGKPVDYRFMELNPTFEQHTGLVDAEGKTAHELLPNLEPHWFEIYGKVAVTGEPIRFIDGSDVMNRWFDVYAFRIGEPEEHKVAVLFNDITERKRLEAERERLYRRESELRAEAEEANRLKDEFLATASHELRTPLTAVVGWTRMLREGYLDETTTARALETIERNANAQTKLIEDLLDISRIITGKLMLDTQPVEVVPVISAAVNTVRPAADAKNIEIETSLDTETGPVLADANRLQQVVWNLLANAVKFTPREGRVTVALRRIDSVVEISVSDTGEGIEPEFLPYVFDRFRQADGSKTRQHGGLGLGLAIVRNLIEMHGGTVTAQSEGRGRGATFSVSLPLLGLYNRGETLNLSSAREEAETADHVEIECPPKLNGLRVLVVDDDEDTREMLEVVLSQCEAEVIKAASVVEALREIERRKPDVLVSDIGMPDEDGYELIRKIREMETGQGDSTALPALALTAYAKAEDRVRALAAGYQVHLAKPVEPAEVMLVIANLAHRGHVSD